MSSKAEKAFSLGDFRIELGFLQVENFGPKISDISAIISLFSPLVVDRGNFMALKQKSGP